MQLLVFLIALFAPLWFFSQLGPANIASQNFISGNISKLQKNSVEIVFMGTSVCTEGVDTDHIQKYAKISASKSCGHIQRSAYYYLYMKNVLANPKLTKKPKYLAILYINAGLTDFHDEPIYGEEQRIQSISTRDDQDILQKFLYRKNTDPVNHALASFFPAYRKREVFWHYLAEKTHLNRLKNKYQINAIAKQTFATQQMIPKLYRLQVKKSEISSMSIFDFSTAIEQSLLPQLITQAKSENIQLLFINMPKLTPRDHRHQNYNLALAKYAAKNAIPLWDYNLVKLFQLQHFSKNDGIHLNASGREVFAQQFAKDLQRYEENQLAL